MSVGKVYHKRKCEKRRPAYGKRDMVIHGGSVKKADGRSFADILKIGLGILEPRVKGESEARKQGHIEGYKKGHAEAERLYKVAYSCKNCGGMIAVTSTAEKEAIKGYMEKVGWMHRTCVQKRQ